MDERSRKEYLRAIELAQQEANGIEEELKGLQERQKRLVQLNTFIEQGKLILGIESVDAPESIKSTPPTPKRIGLGLIPEGVILEKQPIHLKVAQIIREGGKSVNLSELVDEFRKRNWKLSKKNPRQVLRNTIKTNPELFSKKGIGPGGEAFYDLKNETPEE